jgi:hypothetical protein
MKAPSMSDLQNGSLVQHVSLGVGKIVALETSAVHVFFPDADKRFAAKLRLPAARAMLRTEGFEPNGWLAGLTAFALDPKSGRYGLAATWLSHDQAVEQLLAAYPGGFKGPTLAEGKGQASRPARWRAAHAAWQRKLAQPEAERLVAEGEFQLLASRVRDIEKLVAPLHPPADAKVVKEALSDEASARTFLGALVSLLSVPSPGRARFEALFSAARGLPVEPAHQWLVATLFPFLAAPDRHVLLRPRATCVAADRLGCDLRYEPSPNWATYSSLRTLSTRLLERLEPAGATDFIDVELLLHLVASTRRPAPGGAQASAARLAKPRAAKRGAKAEEGGDA